MRDAKWIRLGPTELAVLCALAVILLVGQMAKEWPLLFPNDASRDFAMLYVTAERARERQPLYAQTDPAAVGPLLNFNPPHLHALLIPLTAFPVRTAYLIWNGISVLLLAACVAVAIEETRRRLNLRETYLLAACVLGSAGVAATLRMGQISMWLALLLTLAWRAARRAHWTTSGVWLGLALGVKPFLLFGIPVLLVRRRYRAAVVAGAVAVTSIAAGGVWLGWSALLDWLEVFQAPRGTVYTFNASLAGLVARAGAPAFVAWIVSAVVGVVTLWHIRRSDEDTTWTLWLAAALLCSPLGWIYYLPLLIGPLLVLILDRRLPAWWPWLLPAFLLPPTGRAVLQDNALSAVTAGSIYTWGLLGLWCALLVTAPTAAPAKERLPERYV